MEVMEVMEVSNGSNGSIVAKKVLFCVRLSAILSELNYIDKLVSHFMAES